MGRDIGRKGRDIGRRRRGKIERRERDIRRRGELCLTIFRRSFSNWVRCRLMASEEGERQLLRLVRGATFRMFESHEKTVAPIPQDSSRNHIKTVQRARMGSVGRTRNIAKIYACFRLHMYPKITHVIVVPHSGPLTN